MKPALAAAVAFSGLVALSAAAGADQGSSPPPAPPAFPAAPPQGQAQPPAPAVLPPCRLSEHTGVDDGDAATAARLVCADLAHAGAPPDARYRVSLETLGSLIILSVAREGAEPGSTADSREMTLRGIEEVTVAGPRVAEALVRGVPLQETQTVDNIVGQETRKPATKPGKVHFAMGLTGTFAPFADGVGASPGATFEVHYEVSQVEFGGSIRFGYGGSGGSAPNVGFFEWCVGARYYFTDRDVSPYVGGGVSWSYFNLDVPQGFDGDGWGLGAYADAGFEIMRTHHAHLAFGARLGVPFFSLSEEDPVASATTATAEVSRTYYYVPLSLEARLTF